MAKHNPEPRMLLQGQAAAYCGMCVENFKKACPVKPVAFLDRITRYDRFDLNRWLDSLSTFRSIQNKEDLEHMWDDARQHDAH